MDKIALATFADFLINLSAGWFLAALAVPFLNDEIITKAGLLTMNLVFVTVSLRIALGLRKRIL